MSAVNAADLANFMSSLDEVEQAANGYGSLKRAVIETDLSGARSETKVKVTATYEGDGHWAIEIGDQS